MTKENNKSQENWLKTRNNMLEKLTQEKIDVTNLDKEAILKIKEEINQEIKELEEKHQKMSLDLKDQQMRLMENERKNKSLFKHSDQCKSRLVRLIVVKNTLLNEIKMYEEEKNELELQSEVMNENLSSNILALDKYVKNIGFVKGEVNEIMAKVDMLKEEVPEQYLNVENLDEKILGTKKGLESLFDKVKQVELNAQSGYYKNKQKKRGN